MSTAAPVWTAREVPLAAIPGELDRLWHQAHTALSGAPSGPPLGDGEAAPSEIPSVARARVLNLVAYAADDAHARQVEDLMERLATRHPSRTVIVVAHGEEPGSGVRESPEEAIHATISVRAHAGAEGRRSALRAIDAQVRLDTYGTVEERLPSVIIPLLIPDLPTYLWWSGDPPATLSAWRRMVDLCDRLVVDSADFAAPDSMARFADFVRGARRFHTFADLAWHRLRPWRELLAQCFDHPRYRPCLESIAEARIVAAGPSEALLLAGWLCAALGWEATAAHRLDPPSEGAWSFGRRYDLVGWPSGRALTLIVEPASAAARTTGIARVVLLAHAESGVGADQVRFVVSQEEQVLQVTVEEPRSQRGVPAQPGDPRAGDSITGVVARAATIDPAEETGRDSGLLLARELETLGQDETYEAALAAGYPLGRFLLVS